MHICIKFIVLIRWAMLTQNTAMYCLLLSEMEIVSDVGH